MLADYTNKAGKTLLHVAAERGFQHFTHFNIDICLIKTMNTLIFI